MTHSDTAERAGASPDFFISYTGADEDWAEWVAWVLEEANYSVVIQKWDFQPGNNFIQKMDEGLQQAARTVVILSARYMKSSFATAEMRTAWQRDPLGRRRGLLVFRVEDCRRPGLLSTVISVDLFGVSKEESQRRIIAAALGERGKPPAQPRFPVVIAAGPRPLFPPERRVQARRAARQIWSAAVAIVTVAILVVVVVNAAPAVRRGIDHARAGLRSSASPTVATPTPGPTIVNADGPGPWTVQAIGYTYEVTGVSRTTAAPFPRWWDPPVPAISVRGTVLRAEANSHTSMGWELRDQNGHKLTAPTGTSPDPPGEWENTPTLGQTVRFELVVYDTSPAVTSLTLTITDFHRSDYPLVISNIPVA
ncbi:toll/interleukin-1 receptor domain-containing protein [Parafrankia sp. EUN1f]|uniref:toll/interleukin-1 receptor domain-containing protein n=1 Tax=Parafrankia sp. EUN1f TaxID=102897 RepID=UPI0002DC2F60|nr:toll/interleukin-1 receptor domain-containing protein [Parafrankia sp. EUN1f]